MLILTRTYILESLHKNTMWERIIRSEELTENIDEEVSSGVWQVHSSVPSPGRYTVQRNCNSDCSGCPLSCPVCSVCIHQFVCSCVSNLIRGNFCKHTHACVRYSQPVVHNKLSDVEGINIFEDEKSSMKVELHTV